MTFILTLILVPIINKFLDYKKYFGKRTPVEKAVDDFGDEIEKLFKKAAKDELLIQVVLKSNTIYVGFVDYIPPPKESNYLKIIPLISGYVNNMNKKIVFNMEYYDAILLYQSNEEKYKNFEMDITIKQDEILMANVFDYDVYEAYI